MTIVLSEEPYTESAVYGAILCMKPKTDAIKIIPQGHFGDCHWSRERNKWMLQSLVRFEEDLGVPIPREEDGSLPDMFNLALLGPAAIESVVWADEIHKKQEAQKGQPGKKAQTRFPRDANGKLDLESGTYADVNCKMKLKFPNETHFMLICAVLEMANGNIIGKRGKASMVH